MHHDTKLSLKVKRSSRFCLEYRGLWACYRVTSEGLMQRNGIPHPVSPRSQQPNHDKSSPLIGPDNVCSPVFTCGFSRLNILYVKHYTLSRAGQLDTNLDRSQRLPTSIPPKKPPKGFFLDMFCRWGEWKNFSWSLHVIDYRENSLHVLSLYFLNVIDKTKK